MLHAITAELLCAQLKELDERLIANLYCESKVRDPGQSCSRVCQSLGLVV